MLLLGVAAMLPLVEGTVTTSMLPLLLLLSLLFAAPGSPFGECICWSKPIQRPANKALHGGAGDNSSTVRC